MCVGVGVFMCVFNTYYLPDIFYEPFYYSTSRINNNIECQHYTIALLLL